MTKEHRIILNAIEEALNRDPELRFGQVLFNLGINVFVNRENPAEADYKIRDIHGDQDIEIIERIKRQSEWLVLQGKIAIALKKPELENLKGMTVNERLFVSGLIDDFDKYKTTNKQFARFILERLQVDRDAINKLIP